MSRQIIAAVLPDKDSAYDAGQALLALSRDEDSGFTLFSGVALYRNAQGHPEVLKRRDRPLLGVVSSPAVGGLLGLLAGTDAAPGAAVLGALRDAFDEAIDDSVAQNLLTHAGRERAIVLIDADEAAPQALDAIITAAGGTLFRPAPRR